MTVPGQVASYIEAQEPYTTNYLQLFAFSYYGIKKPGLFRKWYLKLFGLIRILVNCILSRPLNNTIYYTLSMAFTLFWYCLRGCCIINIFP